ARRAHQFCSNRDGGDDRRQRVGLGGCEVAETTFKKLPICPSRPPAPPRRITRMREGDASSAPATHEPSYNGRTLIQFPDPVGRRLTDNESQDLRKKRMS